MASRAIKLAIAADDIILVRELIVKEISKIPKVPTADIIWLSVREETNNPMER